jgi:hypothetical protein
VADDRTKSVSCALRTVNGFPLAVALRIDPV